MECWLKLGKELTYVPDEWEVFDVCDEEYEEEGCGPGTGAHQGSFHEAQQGAERGRHCRFYCLVWRNVPQREYALVSGNALSTGGNAAQQMSYSNFSDTYSISQ